MRDLLGRLNRPRKKALVAVLALMIPAAAVTAAVTLSGREEPARRIRAAASPVATRVSAATASPRFEFRCEKWDNSENIFRCTVQLIGDFREPVTLSCRGNDPRLAACEFSGNSNPLTPPPNGAGAILVSEQHAFGYGTYRGEIVARGAGLTRTASSGINQVGAPPTPPPSPPA